MPKWYEENHKWSLNWNWRKQKHDSRVNKWTNKVRQNKINKQEKQTQTKTNRKKKVGKSQNMIEWRWENGMDEWKHNNNLITKTRNTRFIQKPNKSAVQFFKWLDWRTNILGEQVGIRCRSSSTGLMPLKMKADVALCYCAWELKQSNIRIKCDNKNQPSVLCFQFKGTFNEKKRLTSLSLGGTQRTQY